MGIWEKEKKYREGGSSSGEVTLGFFHIVDNASLNWKSMAFLFMFFLRCSGFNIFDSTVCIDIGIGIGMVKLDPANAPDLGLVVFFVPGQAETAGAAFGFLSLARLGA